jgi:hypothetical protein
MGVAACGGKAGEVPEMAFDRDQRKASGTAHGEIHVHGRHEHGVTSGQGLATSWRSPTSTFA